MNNLILTLIAKRQKYQHYHEIKLINMSVLHVNNTTSRSK